MIINTTTACRCGAEKMVQRQWCDVCWEALKYSRKDGYIRAVGDLDAQIKSAESDMDVDSRKEQPCL